MDATARHLRLLTETIAAVNSSLDLQEVLELVARNVADALGTDACFVYLYDERADELVLRATHGSRVEEMTRTPRMRPGEGITGVAAAERAPVMIPAQAHLDPRFKLFPNLPEDEYESILAVPDPGPGQARRRPQRPHARAARVHRGRDRAARRDRVAGRADDRARAAVRRRAAAGRRARGAGADLGGRLGVALPRGVAGGDREDDDGVAARDRRGARARGREDRLAGGPAGCLRRAAAAALEAAPDRRARLRPRHAVHATTSARCWRPSRTTPPSRSSTGAPCMRGVLAQEIHHRVKNNLQSVASLLRCRRGRRTSTRARRSQDSVNRILAIAAVHEVLTEHREDDVDLGELVDRLRAMLVQGLVAGKDVTAELAPVSLAGQQATALALVFTELFQNALEHGGVARRDLARAAERRGRADDRGRRARASTARARGTGLSIVRALVRDELRGELDCERRRTARRGRLPRLSAIGVDHPAGVMCLRAPSG